MKDQDKTKEQLINELIELRQRIVEFGKSNGCYRNMVERVRDVIYTVSLDGTLTSLNPAFENISGWSCTELIGKPLASFVHPDDWPLAVEMFERMMRGVTPPIHEMRVRKKSGEYFIGEFTITPDISHGKVVGVLGVGRDITERKRAEEKLQESEKLLGTFMSAIQESAFVVDTEGVVVIANETLAQRMGTNLNVLIGTCIYNHLPPEIARERKTQVEEVIRTGKPLRYEDRRAGMWIDSFVYPILSEEGKVMNVGVIAVDITERKQTEEALREREQEFRMIANHVPALFSYVDANGCYRFVNKRYEEWFGMPQDQIVGKHYKEILGEAVDERITGYVEAALRGEEVIFEGALPYLHGGERWIIAKYVPRIDNQGRVTGYLSLVTDITERKRAEEKLIKSESLLKEAQHVASIGHWELDPAVGTPTWSEEIFHIFGLDPAQGEPSFKDHQKIIHPDDWNILNNAVTMASAEGVPFDIEFRLLRPDRSIRWMNAKGYSIKDSEGIVRVFGTAQDITERKQAEEALRRKSEEQALLLDNIQTQVWYLTDEETYGAVNKARAKFFGKKNEEMENKKFYDVLSKDEADICMSGYVEVFKKRKQIHTEEWIMNAKGEKRLLSIIKSPKLNENGDVEYIVCSAEDITDRKRTEYEMKKLNKELERRVIERTAQLEAINKDMQKEITERNEAEEALKASETSYRRLFESAMDGILLLDADTGQITNVNPYLIEMLGYSHNEFLGKKLWEVGLFKHIAESQAGFQKLQSEKYIRYENLPLESKEGRQINVEFVSNVYLEDRQKVIQCNIRDITERRRAEEELKKHEERLEELVKERTQKIRELERQRTEIEKLAAAGLMAARIAHEINNPLAGIKNSFMLVKDAIPQDHPYYKYVGSIDNEINRVARIVRQMFDIYRPEQEIKKEFSVDKTLYEVVALLEAAWQENNITIEIDSKPITMEMPEGLLRQVLYNILVNAIEASPQGGVVKIMTEVDNETLALLISDQGVGIPLEVQPRIFEPFFTGKHGSQKGLGLGLSVSKDIVEKLGGHIDFESEPGKGTLFRIILPLKSGEKR